jgi:hypothetical protein
MLKLVLLEINTVKKSYNGTARERNCFPSRRFRLIHILAVWITETVKCFR